MHYMYVHFYAYLCSIVLQFLLYVHCILKETSNCNFNSFFDQFGVSFSEQKSTNCLYVVNDKRAFHVSKGKKYICSKIFFLLFQMLFKMGFLHEDIIRITINDDPLSAFLFRKNKIHRYVIK